MIWNEQVEAYYVEARQRGRKNYSAQKAKGMSGHLSSIDGVLKDIEIVTSEDIGVIDIPTHRIVGTYYHARRTVFSKDYLPLEAPESEFAEKWKTICHEYLNEGTLAPIKVYEYLNYYYVLDGNKTVSVLKYFDAVKISAQVTRLVPKYDENDDAIKLYYAFLDFYDQTKLVDIWLSKPVRFKRLSQYLDAYAPETSYYDNKYQHFLKYVYRPFRRIYLEGGGEKILDKTTGDAFLLYAKLYGIPQGLDEIHLQEVLPRLLEELEHFGGIDEIEIIQDDEEIKPKSIFKLLSLGRGNKKLKVGFVYARDAEGSGWTYSHDLGRKYIENKYKEYITTGFIDNVPEDQNAYAVIKEFASDGYDVVFTTSEVFRRATASCAVDLPEVKFFNCSGNRPYVHMNNYFGKTYEPRFLAGMIAGSTTKSNIIGYTATDPNPEVISSINAFTLGARMVNPRAEVMVLWTGEWNNPQVTTDLSERLIQAGADIISNKTLLVPRDVTWDYGVYSMLCDIDPETKQPKNYLAAPIWRWGAFYEKIISSILNGSFDRAVSSRESSKKLVNFWWGMETGVLDLYYAKDLLPAETVRLMEFIKHMIQSDQFHPFYGPIYDTNDNIRVEAGEVLSIEDILHLDWFVKGVRFSN